MRRRLILATAAAVALTGLLTAGPARADHPQSVVVSPDPADWTPHVLDGSVNAIAVAGDVIVVGGQFTEVEEADSGERSHRANLFAFDRYSGKVLDFAPTVDGPVLALATGIDHTVYLGGRFKTINGEPHRGLARLSLETGELLPEFFGAINEGDVRSLAVRDQWLYIGGRFSGVNGEARPALARLAADSGALDESFDLGLTVNGRPTVKVEDLALSPDGRRLVVIGALSTAAGLKRVDLAMINTSDQGFLSSWRTLVYAPPCHHAFDTYVRGVDFAPDGSYFVVVTTGKAAGPTRMCDTAARFETRGRGLHRPTWVNHTGGDSLYAVSVTGSAVYVGGHQRWMNNPRGQDSAGPGAVARPGIAAVDPDTGEVLDWNPTKSRGAGVRALVATEEGLFVGSDTDRLGNEYHGRIGLFPLSEDRP